jgi:hypothetical protein
MRCVLKSGIVVIIDTPQELKDYAQMFIEQGIKEI